MLVCDGGSANITTIKASHGCYGAYSVKEDDIALRIDVYGFQAFCEWFLKAYPTYFVSPLWLSGSSVETLFSLYKFTAGGKLDSVNYTTSRAAHLIKQCAASHHSGTSYRDENLSFNETQLQRKTYNHTKTQVYNST